MSIVQRLIAAALLAGASLTAFAQDAVVYHIDEAAVQALRAVRSIRNHLDTDVKAKITVVSHADGVDFLMTGAKDRNGNEYASLVSGLVSRGVRFEICEITLQQRGLKKDQFILEAEFTPSGVVRIAKMQQQGAAYIKP
jgi:intracellular sulfur oxidation DsrE/DsrF family protein